MKQLVGYTELFMSPVNGELASYNQIPPASLGEILVSGVNGYFEPSLDLIDIKIDVNYLKMLTEGLQTASVVVQKSTPYFKNEIVLDDLNDGYMVKLPGGRITTTQAFPPEYLYLTQGEVYVGNEYNEAVPTQTISIDNLPSLGVANVAGLDLPAGQIWRGTSDNRPEASNSLSIIEADILLINGRFLLSNFIMGDALIQYAFPRAQYLVNIPDQGLEGTLLMKLGSVLKAATLTENMVWRGTLDGIPVESPYVSEERLQELVDQAEGSAEEAATSASEASASAGEASASALEASAAALEATGAASEATGAAGVASGAAAAAAGSAIAAGIAASEASGYKDDAQTAANNAYNSEQNASTSATAAQTALNTLLTTGLNALPCTGDVSFNNYRAINLGDPINDQDATTKKWVLTKIDLASAATRSYVDNKTWLTSQITDFAASVTAFTLNQFAKPTLDIDLNNHKIINSADPINDQDLVNKRYQDAAIAHLQEEIDQITPGGTVKLSGFVESGQTTDGVTATTAGPLALLSLIPAGGDVSIQGHRVKDLNYMPEENNDAISFIFLWNLLNERLNNMPFIATLIDANIALQGSTQKFSFGSNQTDTEVQFNNLFQPTTPDVPSNFKLDLLNYAYKGFRSGVFTKNTSSVPEYIFSSVAPSNQEENSTLTSSPLFTFNENQNNEFKFYNRINAPDPTANTHVATKGWVQTVGLAQTSGTFTPIICNEEGQDIIGDSTKGGKGYYLQMGEYTKTGKVVSVNIFIGCSSNSYPAYPGDTTQLFITGLPFTSNLEQPRMIPISYEFCSVNNIIQLFTYLYSDNAVFPLLAIYQSSNQSTDNDSTPLLRAALNVSHRTLFSLSFTYTTDQ